MRWTNFFYNLTKIVVQLIVIGFTRFVRQIARNNFMYTMHLYMDDNQMSVFGLIEPGNIASTSSKMTLSKAELPQEGILFCTQFPSL